MFHVGIFLKIDGCEGGCLVFGCYCILFERSLV